MLLIYKLLTNIRTTVSKNFGCCSCSETNNGTDLPYIY